ncbi:hypothetical protein PACTADRAFT_50795 [Pachysolen tannophilus NRRL Y-2460]|uniref:Uncharacterized protein n=1 Tax=Pachysolen tannophilus NRRL Y-2460 TaxID=669874 RepID=A0A1E4TT86_PACTA|nr:hypothetical protein PACTADRAFT_50795 [Pachysolen tannophilus NRRL Y-2460]
MLILSDFNSSFLSINVAGNTSNVINHSDESYDIPRQLSPNSIWFGTLNKVFIKQQNIKVVISCLSTLESLNKFKSYDEDENILFLIVDPNLKLENFSTDELEIFNKHQIFANRLLNKMILKSDYPSLNNLANSVITSPLTDALSSINHFIRYFKKYYPEYGVLILEDSKDNQLSTLLSTSYLLYNNRRLNSHHGLVMLKQIKNNVNINLLQENPAYDVILKKFWEANYLQNIEHTSHLQNKRSLSMSECEDEDDLSNEEENDNDMPEEQYFENINTTTADSGLKRKKL